MELLVVILIILALVALAQIMKVYELSSKLRNKSEADVTKDETNFNAGMMIVFMVVFLASTVYLIAKYPSTVVGPVASEHGADIDWLYWINWVILLVVFYITQPILFIFAFKYRKKDGVKATFFAHSNKLELIWTVVPAVVLAIIITLGIFYWNNITTDKKDSKTIELYAYQFGWFARYAGEDNALGKSDFKVLDEGANPLGVLTSDIIADKKKVWEDEITTIEKEIETNDLIPDAKLAAMESKVARLKRQIKRLEPLAKAQTEEDDKAALDDIIVKELVLIKGQNYQFKFRSRDVIHSAFFPHFRAQMNCVPGMVTKFNFTPTVTTEEARKDPEIIAHYKKVNEKRAAKGEEPIEFDFLLLCNKICGASHYNMQIKITVVDNKADYQRWYNDQIGGKSFAALTGKNELEISKIYNMSLDDIYGAEKAKDLKKKFGLVVEENTMDDKPVDSTQLAENN